MVLLKENIAGFVHVEMLPHCNYHSILSLRISSSEYLCKVGRKVKLTLITSKLFTCLKFMIDGVSDLPFQGTPVAINLLILC
jgi:hypothetical protein